METKVLTIVAVFLIKTVSGANILAVLPTPAKSHQNVMKAVFRVLVDEHKITYYGPPLNINHVNFTEKHMEIYNFLEDFSDIIFKQSCKKSSFEVIINDILWLNSSYYDSLYQGAAVKQLLTKKEKYDLMITIGHTGELFFRLAHLYDIPLVQVATSIAFPWTNEYIGNPNFYASDISFITPESSDNLFSRFKKYVKTALVMFHYKWRYIPLMDQITEKYYPPGTPRIEEIAKQRTSLLLVNSNSRMGYTRADIPAVVESGGLHCAPAKPLPPELEDFMATSGEFGVIYFSLGSTIRGISLPETIRRGILNVFRKLPQKILWKWEGNMTDLPHNVLTSKWIPQQDVLGHSKLKLFITQGGMLSTQEAAYHGVPMIMMPIIADQYTNAVVMEQNGYGLKIDFCQFTEEEFYNKIQRILRDPTFTRKAKEISSAVKDTELSPRDKVKWWINYILLHKDVTLKPNNTSWVYYSELDIYLTFIFIIVCIVACLIVLIHFIKHYLVTSTKKLKKA